MRDKKFTPKRTQTTAEFRKAAIQRLRERWEQENPDEAWEPENEPIVSPLFKWVDGGVDHVIEALRSHDDEDARSFISCHGECRPGDRKHLPIEYIAYASGIGSLRLCEIAQTAIFLYDGMRTKMLLASGLPGIVAQSIKQAKTPRGLHDREMMLKAGGILPLPKGNQIHIQNLNSGEKETEGPEKPIWREAEDRLREIHDLTEPKRLPSPASAPINVGGRIDHMQEEAIHLLREE